MYGTLLGATQFCVDSYSDEQDGFADRLHLVRSFAAYVLAPYRVTLMRMNAGFVYNRGRRLSLPVTRVCSGYGRHVYGCGGYRA